MNNPPIEDFQKTQGSVDTYVKWVSNRRGEVLSPEL